MNISKKQIEKLRKASDLIIEAGRILNVGVSDDEDLHYILAPDRAALGNIFISINHKILNIGTECE